MGEPLTPAEVLAAVPHRPPFRFIDEILEVDADHILAAYRFREDADFYRGHFPGNPITPGVLLLETMAQAGVVAHGIYLLGRAAMVGGGLTLFTNAVVEFTGLVHPGERVLVRGRRVVFRRRLLRSEVVIRREAGATVCRGTLAGMRVSA
ncbi:MAG: beta-hydroxyacyl-ACP dehydratase [Deltaproteobacteria bacterium]|nr:beta-hydroxyacyl-ACP dehydratase [Deltaproteobacteria bacterium]